MLRSYDPQIGRFLQHDPYDQFASGYVGMGNDPGNMIDPTGGWGKNPIASALKQVACPGTGGIRSALNIGKHFSTVVSLGTLVFNGASAVNTMAHKRTLHAAASNKGSLTDAGSVVGDDGGGGTGAIEECGYEEDNALMALPLTKEVLLKIARQYTDETGGGLEDFAGKLLENAYDDWQRETVLGVDYDPNPNEYITAGVPKRDAVRPDGTRGVKLIFVPKRPPYYPHLSWFEVKQGTVGSSIGKTSYDNQIWGHFSAVSIVANTISSYKFNVRPVLTMVTTYGVKLGPSLNKLSVDYKVDLYHQVAYYYKKCGTYHIGFGVLRVGGTQFV